MRLFKIGRQESGGRDGLDRNAQSGARVEPRLRHPRQITICLAALMWTGAAAAQTTTTYTYDALGRLTASVQANPQGTVTTSIGFDPAGNRVAYTVTGGAGAAAGGDPGSGTAIPPGSSGGAYAPGFVVVPLNGFTVIPIG